MIDIMIRWGPLVVFMVMLVLAFLIPIGLYTLAGGCTCRAHPVTRQRIPNQSCRARH